MLRKFTSGPGGVCELCLAGQSSPICFDFWRQLTVEHLIGESQGGYLRSIRETLERCYPCWTAAERAAMAMQIDVANTVTACSFCNATTSRDRHEKSMDELLREVSGTPDEVLDHVVRQLNLVVEKKARSVRLEAESGTGRV